MTGFSCPHPCPAGEIFSERWRRKIDQTSGRLQGLWEFQSFGCAPDPSATSRARLPDQVLREFRNMKLPALQAQTQPVDRTLVNFDTIFYAEIGRRDFPVGTILGRDVMIRIAGIRYDWDFGDGDAMTTESPGAKYPSKEIVHRYREPGQTVQPSVTVTYRGSFSVDGGAFQPIPGTVTVPGPPGNLDIVEARSELVSPA